MTGRIALILSILFYGSIICISKEMEIAIQASDTEKILLLISANCAVKPQDKYEYSRLAKSKTDKILNSNRFLISDFFRMSRGILLVGIGSYFASLTAKAKLSNNSKANFWDISMFSVNFMIACSGFDEFYKILNRYDLINLRNRALCVEALIEKMRII